MKKNLVRIIAGLLVALLALTLIPMGALAISVDVYEEYHENKTPEWNDPFWGGYYIDTETGKSVTIKTSDYDKYEDFGGELYDLKGVFDYSKCPDEDDSEKEWDKDIPAKSSITFTKNGAAGLLYVPHQHKLSYWYSDGTTHWRECLVCKKFERFHEPFMYQNWCQDGDEDGICNICGGDVPYHDIKVIETEGATITLNRDNASHRMKITADVEAKEGYTAGKVHFIKVRDDGSRQEVTRYKKDGQFWTYMPTYEMEVSVDVTKK